MQKTIYLLICLLSIHLGLRAEVVKGIVMDAETDEPLIGATILAENGHGATTDLDGRYTLTLPSGTHSLIIRYVGYENQTIEVDIKASVVVDIRLKPEVQMLQTAVVVGTALRNTEAAATREMQEAHVTMSGISEQQISKSQDKNASEVIRRIPGVSIIDEKFVMVRGLSQRYNNVWLNGAAVPSSEADQRAFSFDIIPSSQLDNLKVIKSSAPEYPADFSGGFILVNTKDVPSSNSWGIGISGGLNTETHFRQRLWTPGNNKPFGGIETNWRTRSGKPIADLGISADLAHRWVTAQSHTVGLTGSVSYTNSYQTLREMENNMFGAYDVTHDCSNYLRRTTDQQYNNSTRLGAMLGLVWLPVSGNHRIELKQIFNRLTKDRYTYRRGFDAQSDYMEQAEYYYQSRLTYNLGLSGKHTIGVHDNLNWNLGYAFANRHLPDRKRYTIYLQETDAMEIENLNDLNRELSHLNEHILSASVNWEHRFKIRSWQPSLQLGGYAEHRGRSFQTRFFTYAWPNGQLPQSLRDMDLTSELLTTDHYGNDGLYLIEQVDWSNNYQASGTLAAGYLSMHMPFLDGKIEAYGGVRFEHSQTELVSHTQRQ